MIKDEMKNRISMALKDPTLQQGFEIICKELEAEKKLNVEIKARFVKCNTCTDEMKSKCLMFSESLCQGERCEELVDLMGLISKSELEKENAELKEQNIKDCENFNKTMKETKEQWNKEHYQLTKAKEIMRELIHEISVFYIATDRTIISPTVKEAEQFLKDSEVKKL